MSFPLTGTDPSIYESRAGIMRAGATRAGTYIHDPRVTIGGVAREDNLDFEVGITITNTRNAPTTASFKIISGSKPTKGTTVIIGDGDVDNRRFYGYLTEVETTFFDDNPTLPRWECTLTDREWILSRTPVFGNWGLSWPGTVSDAGAIVKEIIRTYDPSLDVSQIQLTRVDLDDFQAHGEKASELIRQLAEAAGVDNFHVDVWGAAHFAQTDPVAMTPHTLTESYVPQDFSDFHFTERLTEFITTVYGFGALTRITGATPCSGDAVTKIPLESTDRIGNLFSGYIPRLKKIVGATAGVSQLAGRGSTVSANVPAGNTSIGVASGSGFHTTGEDGGWARAGEQVFRYHGGGGGAGAATLTGIPAAGPGSLTAPINAGTTIVTEPHISINLTAMPWTTIAGDELQFYSEVTDGAAAAILAAADGSAGFAGLVVNPGGDLDAEGIAAIAATVLAKYAKVANAGKWTTRDTGAVAGSNQVISLATGGISATVRIESVTIPAMGVGERELPTKRNVTAETNQQTFIDMLQNILQRQQRARK